MRLAIRMQQTMGGKVQTLRYDADERQKAMAQWDRVVEDAIPGSMVQLVNMDTDRIVSEYHNNRVVK